MIKPTELMSVLKKGSFTDQQSAALAEAIGLAVKQGTEDMLTNKDLDRALAKQEAAITKQFAEQSKHLSDQTKHLSDQTKWIVGLFIAAVIITLSAAKYL